MGIFDEFDRVWTPDDDWDHNEANDLEARMYARAKGFAFPVSYSRRIRSEADLLAYYPLDDEYLLRDVISDDPLDVATAGEGVSVGTIPGPFNLFMSGFAGVSTATLVTGLGGAAVRSQMGARESAIPNPRHVYDNSSWRPDNSIPYPEVLERVSDANFPDTDPAGEANAVDVTTCPTTTKNHSGIVSLAIPCADYAGSPCTVSAYIQAPDGATRMVLNVHWIAPGRNPDTPAGSGFYTADGTVQRISFTDTPAEDVTHFRIWVVQDFGSGGYENYEPITFRVGGWMLEPADGPVGTYFDGDIPGPPTSDWTGLINEVWTPDSTRTIEFITNRYTSDTQQTLFASTVSSGPRLTLSAGNNNVVFKPDGTQAPNGSWIDAWPGDEEYVHCMFVWDDAAQEATLIINGEDQGTKSILQSYSEVAPGPGALMLGTWTTQNPIYPLFGAQGHLAVYDGDKSALAEEHYQAMLGRSPGAVGSLLSGALADRPLAALSNSDTYYFATDYQGGTLYHSDGTAWTKIAPGLSEGGGNTEFANWRPTGAKIETLPGRLGATTTFTPTSGQIIVIALPTPLEAGETYSSITFMGAGAASTISHLWFALVAKSDLKILRATIESNGDWSGNQKRTIALSSPYTPDADTDAYLAFMIAATSVGTLRAGNGNQYPFALEPVIAGSGDGSLTTPLADGTSVVASVLTLTGIGTRPYGYVS